MRIACQQLPLARTCLVSRRSLSCRHRSVSRQIYRRQISEEDTPGAFVETVP